MLANCRIGSLVTATRSSAASLRPPVGSAARPPVPLFANQAVSSASPLASPLAGDFLPCRLVATRCISGSVSNAHSGRRDLGHTKPQEAEGRKKSSAVHVLRFAFSPPVASAEAAASGGNGEDKSEMGKFKVTLATPSSTSPKATTAALTRYPADWVPVGSHLRVRTVVNRQIAIREFTVVACGVGDGDRAGEGVEKDCVWFDLLVKTYQPSGLVSSILASLPLRSTQLAFKGASSTHLLALLLWTFGAS